MTTERVIAHIEVLTGLGIALFWVLFFTVGMAPANAPPAYFAFEYSFVLSDFLLAVGLLVAGTLVVYQEPVTTESLLLELPAVSESDALPATQLAAVPSEAITLATEYLGSRSELAPRPRQELAAELVSLIRESSGLEPRPAQGVESFLATVVRQSEQGPPWSSPAPEQAELPS